MGHIGGSSVGRMLQQLAGAGCVALFLKPLSLLRRILSGQRGSHPQNSNSSEELH